MFISINKILAEMSLLDQLELAEPATEKMSDETTLGVMSDDLRRLATVVNNRIVKIQDKIRWSIIGGKITDLSTSTETLINFRTEIFQLRQEAQLALYLLVDQVLQEFPALHEEMARGNMFVFRHGWQVCCRPTPTDTFTTLKPIEEVSAYIIAEEMANKGLQDAESLRERSSFDYLSDFEHNK